MRKVSIGLAAAVLVVSMATTALASKPLDGQDPPVESGHKITICHATSSSKPARYWRIISVDVASSGGRNKLRGHVRHVENAKKDGRLDLIPEFTYGGATYAGAGDPGNSEQWDAFLALNPRGSACRAEDEPPPPPPS